MKNLRKTLVTTPLGKDVLVLLRMEGDDKLSEPFCFEVQLLTELPRVDPAQLLGKVMGVKLELPDGAVRYFHGYVAELEALGAFGKFERYRAQLRPWLWLLTRSANCRVFQNKTVPQIVQEVFQKHGFGDVQLALRETYAPLEYCVQYRETDFAFVSRLLEQEGIYYFFDHTADKHTLVLADGAAAHTPWPGFETIKFSGVAHDGREISVIDRVGLRQQIKAGSYTLDDYDFKNPTAELKVRLNAKKPHARSDYELYDYPGRYEKTAEGNRYARVRLEEQHATFERVTGSGNARGLATGFVFTLGKCPRTEFNQRYLVTEAHYCIELDDYATHHGASQGEPYRCDFVAIKATTQFRPARSTPRPVIAGVQSAMVVGPQGDEICTDEFGRVKVQFPWDREGKSDQNSSCFIRVAQVWAGSSWGTQHVPRIGSEVLVSFLEGDPDRPVITGGVYNKTCAAPFALPGQAMVSGTKTKSTKNATGYNELSFDDSKGREKIVLHAEQDIDSTIKRNSTTTVAGDLTCDVQKTMSLSAGTELRLTVGTSEIVLTPTSITINGTTVTLAAAGVLTMRGAVLKGN